MTIDIFTDGQGYYVRGPKKALPLYWCHLGGRWSMERQNLPDGVKLVGLEDLPADLKEEVLAFLARAETMGPSIWSMNN